MEKHSNRLINVFSALLNTWCLMKAWLACLLWSGLNYWAKLVEWIKLSWMGVHKYKQKSTRNQSKLSIFAPRNRLFFALNSREMDFLLHKRERPRKMVWRSLRKSGITKSIRANNNLFTFCTLRPEWQCEAALFRYGLSMNECAIQCPFKLIQ